MCYPTASGTAFWQNGLIGATVLQTGFEGEAGRLNEEGGTPPPVTGGGSPTPPPPPPDQSLVADGLGYCWHTRVKPVLSALPK